MFLILQLIRSTNNPKGSFIIGKCVINLHSTLGATYYECDIRCLKIVLLRYIISSIIPILQQKYFPDANILNYP